MLCAAFVEMLQVLGARGGGMVEKKIEGLKKEALQNPPLEDDSMV